MFFGANPIKEFASKHNAKMWRSLVSSIHKPGQVNERIAQPEDDRNNLRLISDGIFSTLSVSTLRRLVVWITQILIHFQISIFSAAPEGNALLAWKAYDVRPSVRPSRRS